MPLKRFITLATLVIILALLSILYIGRPSGYGLNTIDIHILPGMSVRQAAEVLKEHKLLRSTDLFRWYLRLRANSKIQRGVYELHDGLSVYELAEALYAGKVKMLDLTIPEGWNNRQIAKYLVQKELIKDANEFLRISKDRNQLRAYNISDSEGYLFPDTYRIPYDYEVHELQQLMLKRFFDVLDDVIDREKYSPKQIHQRIILASIIEREAYAPQERPVIAQVFLNRLRRNMKLESCATVQYLFPVSKKRLYFSDLKYPSPYNTYLHKGYPPGPISNPGRASLTAAFQPQPNHYLYFVVKPDRTHHFSQSYSEHLQAKERYIDKQGVIWQQGAP